MSPKQITKSAVIVGAVSILGVVLMLILQPAWGVWNWWPAMGLTLAVSLLVVSFVKGAFMVAQQRVEMVDKLNDCYSGDPQAK